VVLCLVLVLIFSPPRYTLFPYTTLFRSAIQSLKTIWMNDPTGPLADDALMLTATYYLRKGDFLEADHFFTILREEFPKSPHLQRSEEHTSELQSRENLVCRLLLEKKNTS